MFLDRGSECRSVFLDALTGVREMVRTCVDNLHYDCGGERRYISVSREDGWCVILVFEGDPMLFDDPEITIGVTPGAANVAATCLNDEIKLAVAPGRSTDFVVYELVEH